MFKNTSFLSAILLLSIIRTITLLKHSSKQQNCEQYTAQLVNLFNLMCNNLAMDELTTILRDGCIGCFTAASRSNNNQPSLNALSNCASTYLLLTQYDDCIEVIQGAGESYNGQCVAGYCAFVKCIRRINADQLISRCYTSASEDNAAELEAQQIILYKNITSCILAIARCSQINPITGQPQSNTIPTTTYNKWGKPVTTYTPLYNSLQINRAGDLRVIAIPGTTSIQQYFCASEFNLRDSAWMNYTC